MNYKRPEIKHISKFPIVSKILNRTPTGMVEFRKLCYKINNKIVCIQMRKKQFEYEYKIGIEQK
jgi:hypothetical protein